MYKNIFKRVFDFIIAFIGLVVSIPVFIFAGISLLILNKGKVFFLQARPGKNGRIFKVVKFKTMTDEKDQKGDFLPDSQRLTKVGKFIRSTSLDEIPQLFNVLIGDMSIVGPRPLLVQYLPLYSPEQARRHKVKPGITGWAQVNGRNTISWQKKFEYDVWYVDHISLSLDVKIIYLTVINVLKKQGITSETSATMEVFAGNN